MMVTDTTNISTTDGDLQIKEIVDALCHKRDTHIYSYDTKRRKMINATVSSTRGSSTRELIYIETDYDEVKILLTNKHRVFVLGDKRFKRADELLKGESLKHIDGIDVNVIKIHTINNNTHQQVYTLTTDSSDCYFANNILIHSND
jgi:hypothetical protein